ASTPAARARLTPACMAMEAAGRDHGHRPTWERGLQGIAAATAAVDAIVDEVMGGGAEPTPVLAELPRARRAGVLDRAGVGAHLLVLLFAGVETTQNLIANAVHTLLRHPRALAGLRDGAVPSERVVEECLRFEPPVFGVLRRARVPVTLR